MTEIYDFIVILKKRYNFQNKTSFWLIRLIVYRNGCFQMRKIEELDPYALTSYSFTLRKTNSFFTKVTVVITIAILVAAVMVNYTSVQHLWLKRGQLPVVASQTLAFPPALTDTLACYKSTAPDAMKIPPTAKFYSSRGQEIMLPTVSSQTVKITNPLLYKTIGDNFSCLNLTGIEFNSQNSAFYIDVDSPRAKLYLSTASFNSIVDKFQATSMQFEHASSQYYSHILIQFIYTKIYDSLFVGSQPQVTATILQNFNINFSDFTAAVIDTTGTKFSLELFMPQTFQGYSAQHNCNLTEIEMRRLDIAYILGAVLSWVSIFALIFSLVVAPVMDYFLNLQLSKSVFEVPKRFSAPSVLRYIISNLKKGIFPKQDYYVRLCDRLQKLMDISITLKLLKILKQLSPSSKAQAKCSQIGSDYSFSDTPCEQIVNTYQENTSTTPIQFEQSTENSNDNKLSQLRKSLFKCFDVGSDDISVNFDGSGYGSRQSLFLSSAIFIGFVVAMIIIGVADSTTTSTTFKSNGQSMVSYQFQQRQIIILSFVTINAKAKLLDGQFNLIRTLNIISGDNCLQKLSDSEKISLKRKALYFYCLTDSIQLKSALNLKETIQLNIYTDEFIDYQIYAYHSQPQRIKHTQNVPESFQFIKFYGFQGLMYDMVCVQVAENTKTHQKYSQFIYTKPSIRNSFTPGISGGLFTVNREKIITTVDQSTFFDVLENIWSFSVICFSFVLMKVTKYINMGQKDKIINEERADNKSNMCILLAKTHGLMNGRNKAELQRIKYYTKRQLKPYQP